MEGKDETNWLKLGYQNGGSKKYEMQEDKEIGYQKGE